jgi:hypothetical protein
MACCINCSNQSSDEVIRFASVLIVVVALNSQLSEGSHGQMINLSWLLFIQHAVTDRKAYFQNVLLVLSCTNSTNG